MALVRNIIVDALTEIGAIAPGDTLNANDAALGLLRAQNMIDAWAAIRLTLSQQLRTVFTMPSGTSSIQIGPGAAVDIARPVWLNTVNYLIPGSSPSVEVPIGIMDEDAYAALSIKSLSSALPIQCFYQTNVTDAFGTLFIWPQVSQDVQIAIYAPQAVGTPATLNTDLIGPPGYQEAFMYQLALRLMTPFGKQAADVPLLVGPNGAAARAMAAMQRPNVEPGVMTVDAALVPHSGAGYNILSDVSQSSR